MTKNVAKCAYSRYRSCPYSRERRLCPLPPAPHGIIIRMFVANFLFLQTFWICFEYVNASIPKDYVKKLFSWNYFNTSKHYFREVILINKFLAMCDSFSLNKMTISINIAPIKFLTNHWSHGAHFVIFEHFAPPNAVFLFINRFFLINS